MMDTYLLNNSTVPCENNEDDLFRENIEEIVFKKNGSLIIKNGLNVSENLKKHFSKTQVFKTIELNLCITEGRKDCIQQILLTIKDFFQDNITLSNHFDKISSYNISAIIKDDTTYKFFKEITSNYRIVLIFNNFDIYNECINTEDYHLLSQLNKKHFGKLSYFLISSNKISINSFYKYEFLKIFECFESISYRSFYFEKITYEPIITEYLMNNMDLEIFISYARNGESEEITNEICKCLENRKIKYHRDIKDLSYKDNIIDFEESIGKGNYVILIISDKFLKSKDCMFEILQIIKNGNIYDRIFPIVLEDTNIYDPMKIIDYYKYWEIKIEELDAKMKTINLANQSTLRDDIDNYTEYRKIIGDFTKILRQMHTLSPEIHKESDFSIVIDTIEKQYNKNFSLQVSDSNEVKLQENKRTINQYGEKSIYIEKNDGNITIN